jgi:type VI protein secretion system component Hcp
MEEKRGVRSCKPPHAGLFVTKVSKASPKLFLACTTGQHIKEAVLVGGVEEGKDRQEGILQCQAH